MRDITSSPAHARTRSRITRLPDDADPRRPGRPPKYGKKVFVRNLFRASDVFAFAPSPVYGERSVQIQYRSVKLLWRPVARPVQFVLVRHPHRGSITLMTTDTDIEPLDVIRLYGYRFKIESGFRQALHVIGTYAYHFWMSDMRKHKRRTGDQDLRTHSDRYRAHVWRKIDAYHRYIQLACIAQGLLQHLAIRFRDEVWDRFRSWLRTMDPTRPPSELVVTAALRNSLPEFLADAPRDEPLAKILRRHQTPDLIGCCRCASG